MGRGGGKRKGISMSTNSRRQQPQAAAASASNPKAQVTNTEIHGAIE